MVSTSGKEEEIPSSRSVLKSTMAGCSRSRGLWDGWKDSSGRWVKTCSILTTTPNAVTSAMHDRMPVILDPNSYDLWLDPGMQNVAAISELLKPYDARLMRCYPVSTRINHVANDDAECSRPVEIAEAQNRLFGYGFRRRPALLDLQPRLG
jgi:hypothetical protein